MPWKVCKPMDERLKFVARLLDGEQMAPAVRISDRSHSKAVRAFLLMQPEDSVRGA
jgi:hypothetical protein